MLTALHIQDFVLIDQASLPLSAGLTVLTGETGAGKSILLDALGLAIGGRAERASIRQGAERGAVSATFEPGPNHLVWRLFEENGLRIDDDQVILRRVQTKAGKSRAFINDQPVSISLLKKVGGALLEMHGQHEGQGFLTATTHRHLLDDFGGLGDSVKKLAALYLGWREAEEALNVKRVTREKALSEADYLRHITEELHALAPEEGEEETLAARRAALIAVEKVSEDLALTVSLLSEDGFEDKLSTSARRLTRTAGMFPEQNNPLTSAVEKIDSALSEVMEARSAVEEATIALGGSPGELELVEERLFALRAMARKHGVSPDRLPAFFEKAATALATLDEDEAGFGALEEAAQKTRSSYEAAASKLSQKRLKAARNLDSAVMKELAPLKLGKAQFSTQIESFEDRPGSDGIDQVEFMVSTNPGAAAGPLKTIASGGELSRFVLAMKAALAAKESRTVIIFDEVDAGVGGAVADAVGERLARLARDAQVLVVTHSPQVAARADWHWRIEKIQTRKATITDVSVLSPDERIEELARMLSGASVTDEARAAARTLLGQEAGTPPVKRRKSA